MSIPQMSRWLGALAVLGLVSGCAQVYTGEAQRDADYDANTVNLALLDTGNYPTKPRDALGNANDPVKGAVLEGHRLAENVVLPIQVDRTLNHVGYMGSGVMKSPKAVGVYLENDDLAAAVQTHNYLTGYVAAANDAAAPDFNQNRYLQNAVLEFPSDDAAAAAAAAMARASDTHTTAIDKVSIPVTAASVPGYPGTLARSWTQHYDTLNKTDYSFLAFTPRSRYVLVQSAISQKDLPDAMSLVTKTLDQQVPLIDTFTPTAPDQLANLPLDPSGLIVRMNLPDEKNRTVENGSYGPQGALIFQPDPLAAPQRFAELGIDLLIYQDGFVTRAKDPDSARKFLDYEVGDQTKGGWTAVDGIPGLPGARCMTKAATSSMDHPTFWCAVTTDRLILESNSAQEIAAKQKLAAGYLMLTAS